MTDKRNNPKVDQKPPKADYVGEDPLKEAVGIWKDRWPDDKTSTEIAKEMREQQWKRS
ncbi:hypothetical protein LX73_2345 [Fodinibius salinus]|uniref:Uncharacterized protein n=1 Tax=Fodinibius salinus TaxID=860790 RepID=A0A5D3YF41_9BACT|nr:hypothetical protein [Fodinibius salinus]TYP92097.1 hypothetical protein LX73_2345 [Fodinibius salinus]